MSSIEAMHQVLSANKRNSTFLKNIVLVVSSTSRSPAKCPLEAQVEAEQASDEILRSAIEEMHKCKESADPDRKKYHEDIQAMHSKQVEMEKKQEESNHLLKQLVAKFTLTKLP